MFIDNEKYKLIMDMYDNTIVDLPLLESIVSDKYSLWSPRRVTLQGIYIFVYRILTIQTFLNVKL